MTLKIFFWAPGLKSFMCFELPMRASFAMLLGPEIWNQGAQRECSCRLGFLFTPSVQRWPLDAGM